MDIAGSEAELERTHVPLPVVSAAVEELGYTTNSMVEAIGGDRAVEEPLNEHWRPVYVGGTRWLPRTATAVQVHLGRRLARLQGLNYAAVADMVRSSDDRLAAINND